MLQNAMIAPSREAVKNMPAGPEIPSARGMGERGRFASPEIKKYIMLS